MSRGCGHLRVLRASWSRRRNLLLRDHEDQIAGVYLRGLADGPDGAADRTTHFGHQSPEWIDRWISAASVSMDWLDARMHLLDGAITIGHITIGCALGYFEVRFAGDHWQTKRPNLAHWFAEFSQRRHEIVYQFLLALGVSQRTASIDSEGIEHHVSDETLRLMENFGKTTPN